MKRALISNVNVIPGGTDAVIDRSGFLSAIFAASVSAFTGNPDKATLTLTITHSDTEGGTFEPVTDERIGVDDNIAAVPIVKGGNVNIDLDLLGCKQFIKITPAINFEGGTSPSATATYAVALGDKNIMPV